jgi:N6-adenosine-specific RNA methylase IME4
MTSTALSEISRKHVTTVPAAIKALANMERELSLASTYVEIRKIIDLGNALKQLFKDVDLVKAEAEDVILAASARIGEEIGKVPKAGNRFTAQGKSASRKDAMPSGTSRARYQKLAAAKPKLKAIAKKLRAEGKDATVTAVVREITYGSKAERRAAREMELGKKQLALPDKKYGVILADPEWQFEFYSPRGSVNSSADNHYETSPLDVIKARDVPSIAADDCVLFLWATVPMLPHALEVMAAWGFLYVSNFAWVKDKTGTGYWSRNQHELLLIGRKGDIPAPAPGMQWPSVIEAPVAGHSAKPEKFLELIEAYFPTLPKIELNRRGPARAGWDAWGNEAEPAEAAA